MIYENNETKELHSYLALCTNESNKGQLMVVYCPLNKNHNVLVMDYDDFYSKFTEVS